MSKAKSGLKSAVNGAEKEEMWLVRMPGGPLRLIRSNRELTENRVKEIYLKNLKFIRATSKEDPDAKWPFLMLTTDDEVKKKHSWLIHESLRKNHRGLIEVVDGVVKEDVKPPRTIKRVRTKVDVTAG